MTEMQELDPHRMVVLSLKPRFAEAILAGVKTVELRRTVPRIEVPTRALLYATTPLRALLGTCVISRVQTAGLAALWSEYGSRADLSHQEFRQYFEGVAAGTALELAQPQALSQPIPLRDLRTRQDGFRPPQSYSYVGARIGNQLIQQAA
ncbi:MAG: hypothetical protein OXE79_10145 [Acidimicrobiaceae bacterium]|nr:hypothetical protein [Acidimicrobiaceae bacterium]MCY4279275.1 hypothetical protein [Acidimicrobiaceae bacterium]MCY4294655.1 hypothetical protein [Acidimicrobiaceae bacterium]